MSDPYVDIGGDGASVRFFCPAHEAPRVVSGVSIFIGVVSIIALLYVIFVMLIWRDYKQPLGRLVMFMFISSLGNVLFWNPMDFTFERTSACCHTSPEYPAINCSQLNVCPWLVAMSGLNTAFIGWCLAVLIASLWSVLSLSRLTVQREVALHFSVIVATAVVSGVAWQSCPQQCEDAPMCADCRTLITGLLCFQTFVWLVPIIAHLWLFYRTTQRKAASYKLKALVNSEQGFSKVQKARRKRLFDVEVEMVNSYYEPVRLYPFCFFSIFCVNLLVVFPGLMVYDKPDPSAPSNSCQFLSGAHTKHQDPQIKDFYNMFAVAHFLWPVLYGPVPAMFYFASRENSHKLNPKHMWERLCNLLENERVRVSSMMVVMGPNEKRRSAHFAEDYDDDPDDEDVGFPEGGRLQRRPTKFVADYELAETLSISMDDDVRSTGSGSSDDDEGDYESGQQERLLDSSRSRVRFAESST